jgi:tetratricopeptide (TPR) repeat protein
MSTSDKSDQEALERAYEYLSKGNYADALSSFDLLARRGSLQANVYLGWMHQKGFGTRVDLKTAEGSYRVAASSGFVLGQYYLANLLRLSGNLSEALEWYEKAAAQRHSSASYWASVMYREGDGTSPDKTKSEKYLAVAASLGHYFAERDLARNRLRSAKTIVEVFQGLLAYIRAVIRGSIAAIRNPDETQLR